MEQGMIFDVAHGSFVDGPGIRTTVFFKGCNLKCRWCHNPESQNAAAQMLFYRNKCTACGLCQTVCPNKGEACRLCGACVRHCPSLARKVCGSLWSVSEVMQEILKDESFYRFSDGGVTFSGGECMLQPDFLKELLIQCRQAGIHTAVDTAGLVPWSYFEEILPYTNAFLYDVKCVTEQRHREGTGVSNRTILQNLEKLSACFDGDIFIRIPLIPGFNTDREELEKMAAFLQTVSYKKIELLPYHELGVNKYAALGEEGEHFCAPTQTEMKAIEGLFQIRKETI